MHRTEPGGRVIGKTWFPQNQVKYGYQDITARGEGGYRGTGDKQKKALLRAKRSIKTPDKLLCAAKALNRRLK
jgi:hypothetical protein